MSISEGMIKNVVEMLLARLPDDARENAGAIMRRAVELGAQLDRIEARQTAIELSLGFIVAALKTNGDIPLEQESDDDKQRRLATPI